MTLCPQCGDNQCTRSHTRGLVDEACKTFNVVPYRCQTCRHRFYAGGNSSKTRSESRRRLLTAAGLFGVVGLVAFFVFVNRAPQPQLSQVPDAPVLAARAGN
jgi:hypothetical protein